MVNRLSYLNLLRITPRAILVILDSITFLLVFGQRKPISTANMGQQWDECLCPASLIKKAKPKIESNKLSVIRKMGLMTAVSNATVANWLKETSPLTNIRASGESTRKTATSYATSQGASIRTIMEAGDWDHISTIYGHYIRCLPKEVLVRILEQTLASIQGEHGNHSHWQPALSQDLFSEEDMHH